MTPAAERRPLLPFAWARAHHLVLLSDGECCEALCRPDTAARALLEARRLADGPMRVSRLAPDAFEKVLVLSYQRDSAEAHRMMADIGNELDLYTLAEELPDTDDLLDSEDDAPIIRLINAMLTEAIKEKPRIFISKPTSAICRSAFASTACCGNSAPAAAAGRPVNFAHQGDGQSGHCRKAGPSGWPHGAAHRRASNRRARLHPALQPRRTRRPASAGQKQRQLDLLTLGMPPALLDRVDALIARPHGIIPGHRSDRLREKHDALRRPQPPRRPGAQHHDH